MSIRDAHVEKPLLSPWESPIVVSTLPPLKRHRSPSVMMDDKTIVSSLISTFKPEIVYQLKLKVTQSQEIRPRNFEKNKGLRWFRKRWKTKWNVIFFFLPVMGHLRTRILKESYKLREKELDGISLPLCGCSVFNRQRSEVLLVSDSSVWILCLPLSYDHSDILICVHMWRTQRWEYVTVTVLSNRSHKMGDMLRLLWLVFWFGK